MTNWTCTTLAWDHVLLRAVLCKGRCHTGHNKHVFSMKTKCQVPLFQSINPFSSSATNISIYHVLMIMSCVLHIFAPYSPWYNLQQNIDSLYFRNWLMCKLLLYCVPSTSGNKSGLKCGWERIWLVSMLAASIASKIKHNDVYHQEINYNCWYLLYYIYHKLCNQ